MSVIMSDAVPIVMPGSSSHSRGSFAPRGGAASGGSKGKGRAPAANSAGTDGEREPKKFRHRKTKEEIEFEKEGKRLAAGGDGGLGANKLKASLRQARRLVAKVCRLVSPTVRGRPLTLELAHARPRKATDELAHTIACDRRAFQPMSKPKPSARSRSSRRISSARSIATRRRRMRRGTTWSSFSSARSFCAG